MRSTSERSAQELLLQAARDELADKGEAALSLRAVARRASLSHAAPAHFFGDKAGLLTAIATEGFLQLADDLAKVDSHPAPTRVADLGRVYVHFGLTNPALIDLMFRGSLLHGSDSELNTAKQAAIEHLARAVAATRSPDPAKWTVISWALVHGLVALTHEGAIAALVREDVAPEAAAAELVDEYVAHAFA